jgi:hypothetical protein
MFKEPGRAIGFVTGKTQMLQCFGPQFKPRVKNFTLNGFYIQFFLRKAGFAWKKKSAQMQIHWTGPAERQTEIRSLFQPEESAENKQY